MLRGAKHLLAHGWRDVRSYAEGAPQILRCAQNDKPENHQANG
jgi:hypothetical protein